MCGIPGGGGQHPDYDEPEDFDDGMKAFAKTFREMNRWHTESHSFYPQTSAASIGSASKVFFLC
jgi:hypothetical protein